MKNLLLVLAFAFANQDTIAQNCASFYLLQNNKTVELAVYNKKGNLNGTIIYKVSSPPAKSNTVTSIVHTNLLDKEGKSVNKGVSNVKCSNGVVMIDMNLFLPQQQTEQFNKANAKVKHAFLEYPAAMKTGDQLKDGAFNMEIDNNGLKQILKMQVINRKVTGTEKVITKAGTWDCIAISYEVRLDIQTGPISIPLNYKAVEWYVPAFGIVKTVSETGSTEIVAIDQG